jgi:hypothetical protein
MAALTSYSNMNIAEVNKRAGYDNLANVLGEVAKRNDFVSQVPWLPSTHGLYNKSLQATRLGAGAFSKINGPTTSISSSTDFNVEPVKMYEGDSEVDQRILLGADDPRATRDSEDALNLKGMMDDWAYNLFYGSDVTAPDSLKSLAQRRAKLSTYCIGASGTGSDLTDLWTMELGPSGFYLAYAKGGSPGFVTRDEGKHKINVPTGSGQYWAWIRHYEINAAIVLRNERALIRYTNIETSGSSNIFDAATYIKKVQAQLPSMGRDAINFGNRTLVGQLTADAYAKSNAAYSIQDIEGFGPVMRIVGIPVMVCEVIPDTVTALTA